MRDSSQARSQDGDAAIDVAKVEAALADLIPGLRVMWKTETTSTNDDIRQLAGDATSGWNVIAAETQTEGRGRYTRTWQSPSGGLYLSVLLRIEAESSPITLIPLLVGLALKEAIESELARLGGGAFHGWLKWPNDLITHHGKLAGILCEASAVDGVWEIIVGAGLNLNPVDLSGVADKNTPTATSLRGEYPAVLWKREDLLIAILQKLYEWLQVWKTDPSQVRTSWLDASGIEGKEVVATSMGEKISGVATGLGENGELLIQTSSGVHRLNAAEALIVHDDWRR